ncbi:MAG: ATP synthase F1 subunit delta [Chitinophagaceae bacterium]|nr:MAG: ATP synthase F1 subunit delta [Chitinophagaceae bacterium]
MNNPRLAGRYAKSLLGIAIEQNNLEAVFADITLLQGIMRSNPDVVNLLKSPVIGSDKKGKILAAILEGKISTLSNAFIQLLTKKSRESNLPEIVKAFTEQYNEMNNIHIVKLTTATAISDELKAAIVAKVKSDTGLEKIQMETAVQEELIGGFKLEMRGNLVDASILRDLNDVKKQFANNEYMHSIR